MKDFGQCFPISFKVQHFFFIVTVYLDPMWCVVQQYMKRDF